MKEKDEAKVHPFAIAHPVLFNEEMLIPLQSWSPTARIYLKAYKLVKKGFEILRESRFTDKKGISFIAYGYLTENSILQAFPQLRFLSKAIFQLSDQILQKKPSFLEALVVSLALQPTHKLSAESFKTTSKKRVCLMNLIRFIEVAEPNEVPCESSFEFDKNYSSWLHVLYYHIGSMEMIEDSYEAAAEAFENSLKCCPSYFDSKRGLGYALLQLYLGKRVNRDTESNKSDSPAELAPKPKHEQKALERERSKYASYSSEQLRNASVCILKEFLQEAPSCFKKYPNAYYYLAYLAFAETNMEELRKYYELGQDAEEKRLPFHDPVDLPMKDTVSPVYQLFANVQIPRGCGNMACSKKIRKDELRSCACKKEKYCDRDCQRADWDRHKTTCSAKGKKAKNDKVCQNTASM